VCNCGGDEETKHTGDLDSMAKCKEFVSMVLRQCGSVMDFGADSVYDRDV